MKALEEESKSPRSWLADNFLDVTQKAKQQKEEIRIRWISLSEKLA